MEYCKTLEAKFLQRPNRFTAHVEVSGKIETIHVKNTGRCKELLPYGAKVYLEESDNTSRKTKYDLIAVKKGDRLINMDSQAPNKVFLEWVRTGKFLEDVTAVKPECKYRNSRFDFYIEAGKEKIFVEVKGVTLEKDGVVLFPDAPTERGVKHINELISATNEGYKTYIVFIIQMENVKYFTPNFITHKEFGDALIKAQKCGVNIIAVDCAVTKNSLNIKDFVPVKLEMRD